MLKVLRLARRHTPQWLLYLLRRLRDALPMWVMFRRTPYGYALRSWYRNFILNRL